MFDLFESSDSLNNPIECFEYNASKHPFPVKQHWHYYMEIVYIISGTAVMNSNNDYYTLVPGDMLIFHPKVVHSVSSDEPENLRYQVFKFDISKLSLTPNYAPKIRSIFKCAEQKNMRVLFHNEETLFMGVNWVFQEGIWEIEHREYGFDMLAKANIYRLLMRILRAWQKEGFEVNEEAYALDETDDIESITRYIDSHISESLKVSDLASRCGMSYSYFAKRFQHIYGRSCKEYIEIIRIFKAEEYLLFTDFDLNYIAQETGFSDCSHLIKSFKEYRGNTPAQFRKLKKQAALNPIEGE